MMAVNPTTTGGLGNYQEEHSAIAGADLSGCQFKFVKLTSSGLVVCDTNGEHADGILLNEGTTGAVVKYASGGTCNLWMNASCIVGAKLTTTTAGKGVACATGTAGVSPYSLSGDYCNAIAVQAAGAQNDFITVQIVHAGVIPTTLI